MPDGKEKIVSTLKEIAFGKAVKVLAINGEGPIVQRLMEMGILPGVTIKKVKAAPFGDPIEIRLRASSLAIRECEAAKIEVVGV
ncbi:MAG TPA: ferrous iron transport protein A [Pyrinomonadaceae bacterium]|jgi:Fe2+ transport system protein FeoA|nr:ferrous iron transport protein A [Pyrinomonadaceae bacterium]